MKRLFLALALLAGLAAPASAQNGGQGLGSVVTQQALQQLTAPLPGDLMMLFRGQNGNAVFGQFDSSYVFQSPGGTSIPGVVPMCYSGYTTVAGTPIAIPCPMGLIQDTAGEPLGGAVLGTYSPPLRTTAGPQLNCGLVPVLSKWNPLTGCFNP
jgi:hypothetical protein